MDYICKIAKETIKKKEYFVCSCKTECILQFENNYTYILNKNVSSLDVKILKTEVVKNK